MGERVKALWPRFIVLISLLTGTANADVVTMTEFDRLDLGSQKIFVREIQSFMAYAEHNRLLAPKPPGRLDDPRPPKTTSIFDMSAVKKAHADDMIPVGPLTQWKAIPENRRCVFGGWISMMFSEYICYFPGHTARTNVTGRWRPVYEITGYREACRAVGYVEQVNAGRMTEAAAIAASKWVTAENIEKVKRIQRNSGYTEAICRGFTPDTMLCNPALYGLIPAPARGVIIPHSRNSSLDCLKLATRYDTIKDVIRPLTDRNNTELRNNFSHLIHSLYNVCICGKGMHPWYAKVNFYHRTCHGLVGASAMLASLAKNEQSAIAGQCPALAPAVANETALVGLMGKLEPYLISDFNRRMNVWDPTNIITSPDARNYNELVDKLNSRVTNPNMAAIVARRTYTEPGETAYWERRLADIGLDRNEVDWRPNRPYDITRGNETGFPYDRFGGRRGRASTLYLRDKLARTPACSPQRPPPPGVSRCFESNYTPVTVNGQRGLKIQFNFTRATTRNQYKFYIADKKCINAFRDNTAVEITNRLQPATGSSRSFQTPASSPYTPVRSGVTYHICVVKNGDTPGPATIQCEEPEDETIVNRPKCVTASVQRISTANGQKTLKAKFTFDKATTTSGYQFYYSEMVCTNTSARKTTITVQPPPPRQSTEFTTTTNITVPENKTIYLCAGAAGQFCQAEDKGKPDDEKPQCLSIDSVQFVKGASASQGTITGVYNFNKPIKASDYNFFTSDVVCKDATPAQRKAVAVKALNLRAGKATKFKIDPPVAITLKAGTHICAEKKSDKEKVCSQPYPLTPPPPPGGDGLCTEAAISVADGANANEKNLSASFTFTKAIAANSHKFYLSQVPCDQDLSAQTLLNLTPNGAVYQTTAPIKIDAKKKWYICAMNASGVACKDEWPKDPNVVADNKCESSEIQLKKRSKSANELRATFKFAKKADISKYKFYYSTKDCQDTGARKEFQDIVEVSGSGGTEFQNESMQRVSSKKQIFICAETNGQVECPSESDKPDDKEDKKEGKGKCSLTVDDKYAVKIRFSKKEVEVDDIEVYYTTDKDCDPDDDKQEVDLSDDDKVSRKVSEYSKSTTIRFKDQRKSKLKKAKVSYICVRDSGGDNDVLCQEAIKQKGNNNNQRRGGPQPNIPLYNPMSSVFFSNQAGTGNNFGGSMGLAGVNPYIANPFMQQYRMNSNRFMAGQQYNQSMGRFLGMTLQPQAAVLSPYPALQPYQWNATQYAFPGYYPQRDPMAFPQQYPNMGPQGMPGMMPGMMPGSTPGAGGFRWNGLQQLQINAPNGQNAINLGV